MSKPKWTDAELAALQETFMGTTRQFHPQPQVQTPKGSDHKPADSTAAQVESWKGFDWQRLAQK
ncbi:MAG TPA: hypothetical protein VIN59_06250 [Alphaproteobacteria bacterium]